MFRFELIQAHDDEQDRADKYQGQEAKEEGANGRLGEGVNGGDNPTADNKGSVNHQGKGADDQPHIPQAEHAPFFLDHDRMQEGRRR